VAALYGAATQGCAQDDDLVVTFHMRAQLAYAAQHDAA
jgi:hypothetical protein